MMFLFHIGAIKSLYKEQSQHLETGFYSTLVRLKVMFFATALEKIIVSIPHWCD